MGASPTIVYGRFATQQHVPMPTPGSAPSRQPATVPRMAPTSARTNAKAARGTPTPVTEGAAVAGAGRGRERGLVSERRRSRCRRRRGNTMGGVYGGDARAAGALACGSAVLWSGRTPDPTPPQRTSVRTRARIVVLRCQFCNARRRAEADDEAADGGPCYTGAGVSGVAECGQAQRPHGRVPIAAPPRPCLRTP